MIFNEKFYESNQPYNSLLHVRQAGELFEDPSYCIERENSKTATIAFIMSGTLIFEYDNKRLSLCRGDSAVFPQLRKYVFKADPYDPPRMLWINIRGSLFENIFKTIFKDADFPISVCNLENDIRKVFSMLESNSDFSELASQIIRILLKIYESPSSKLENQIGQQTLIGQFEHYISNCIQNGFSISKMCDDFFVSKDTLNRIFKESLNTTPYRYYQDMRLSIAKSLLQNSNLSIDDIANRLKFSDRNNFTSFFIKNSGVSPAKYRSDNKQ